MDAAVVVVVDEVVDGRLERAGQIVVRPRSDDAERALACALEMAAEIRRWNGQRGTDGGAPIGIGIGLHCGEAVAGDIGDARRLEYAVLGDVVNVASRLERLTRETGAVLFASDDRVQAVRDRGHGRESELGLLRPDSTRTVRGRREPVAISTASASDLDQVEAIVEDPMMPGDRLDGK